MHWVGVRGAPSRPTPTSAGLMAANGTLAPGGCRGLLTLGAQTWSRVCLGFLFNSINIYYFVQALGEVLLSLSIAPSLEDFAFCLQDERKGTQKPAAPGLLVKSPMGTSESA